MAEMNKIEFLECENKLLLSQQNNYKDLCKVLTERHVEILKYLSHLKTYIEKMLSISKENVMYSAYINDKSIQEGNIVKYDKQIQILTESIQSSQAQISDNEENLFKEQLKLLSTTLDPSCHSSNNASPPVVNYTKYRCDSDCTEEFNSKHLLESHLRNQHNMNLNFNATLEPNHYANNGSTYASKKETNEAKMNDVLFAPQMELEVLDYNSYPNDNNHTDGHSLNIDKNNGCKKLAPCEFCGKYFNKHYLESHKRSHTGAKPFKCSINGCNRSFTQSSSRNFHEKRFHKVSKFVFKCSYASCEMSFDSLEEMQKHLQQHQALINTVAHSIEINGIKLAHPQIQNNSVKVKTNRSKSSRVEGSHKHVCVHCGKSFAYKIALKQHGLMHGNKNFRCPYENCNYASYWKHNLGLHLRKHHNSEPQ